MKSLSCVAVACVLPLVAFAACVGEDPAPVNAQNESDGGPTGNGDSGPTQTQDGGGNDAGGDAGPAACVAPFADCDGNGSCETKTDNDPKHCGACGHDCGKGASCTNGQCQPVTLASSLTNALAVSVNTTAMAVLLEGGPRVGPKDGSTAPTALVSGETIPAGPAPHTIWVDGTDAYWLGRQGGSGSQFPVRKCALTGCGLSPVDFDDAQLGNELVGDGGAMLRYDPTGVITRLPTNGSAKQYLSSATIPSSLHFALSGGKMAFSNTDSATATNAGAWVGDFANAVPSHLMNKAEWVGIANGNVYASRAVDGTSDAVFMCAFTGCGGIGANIGDTGPTIGTGKIFDLTADATGVYWVERAGTVGRIMRCALPDCAGGPKALAVSQDKPVAITTDDKFVYWVNAGVTANTGAVMRVAK